MSSYSTDPKPTVVYNICRGILKLLMPILYPVRVHGKENIKYIQPKTLVIANHKAFVDPLAIAYLVPHHQIHFIAKRELSKNPFARWLFDHLHVISVSRHATDMSAMRLCMTAVKNDCILGIFPEGTRHQPELMQEVESGTAMIALRTGIPVIPVYIDRKMRPFRRTHLYFCPPMQLDDLYAAGVSKETINDMSGRIRDHFLALRDEHSCK